MLDTIDYEDVLPEAIELPPPREREDSGDHRAEHTPRSSGSTTGDGQWHLRLSAGICPRSAGFGGKLSVIAAKPWTF